MAKMVFDTADKRRYEMGVREVALYPYDTEEKEYGTGVPWNGVVAINESPEGGEVQDLWADDMKYASFRTIEQFKGSIEAYTCPDEFYECDGSAQPVTGLYLTQQSRKMFALVYKTGIGTADDPDMTTRYMLHIVYGATANPAEREHATINDSPDPETMSWDFDTDPIHVSGYRPISHLQIDSTKVNATKLAALEGTLYGKDPTTSSESGTEPTLVLPANVITALSGT